MKKFGFRILGGVILIGVLTLLYIKPTTVDSFMKDCLPDDIKNEADNLQNIKSICEDSGGIIQLYNDEGGNFSLCLFDDGSFCESWEFYRGECEKGNKKFEEFLDSISESKGLTVGEEQCIESGYNWIQGDCMSGENIIKIIDSDPYTNNFFDGFTGNIINGSDGESYIITGDNTLYYNDNYGFAIKLGKEWNGAKIEIGKWCEECTETDYPHHMMIKLLKPKVKEDWPMDWYSIITFSIVNKTEYEKIIELSKGDPMCDEACIKDTIIGHNNKYYFQLGYTNMDSSDVYDLFEGQLDCKLNYPEDSEWNYPWLPRNCSETLPKIVPEYHFYSIMSNLPSILED